MMTSSAHTNLPSPADTEPDPATLFVGREWLFDRVHGWLEGSRVSTLLIVAPTGWGKTAFAAQYVSIDRSTETAPEGQQIKGTRSPGRVLLSVFCRFNDPATTDSLAFVRSLISALGSQLPGFPAALAQTNPENLTISSEVAARTVKSGGKVIGVQIENLHLADMPARRAFERFVRAPLAELQET